MRLFQNKIDYFKQIFRFSEIRELVMFEFYCDENNPAAFVLRGLLD